MNKLTTQLTGNKRRFDQISNEEDNHNNNNENKKLYFIILNSII